MILIVEVVLELLGAAFEDDGYEVVLAKTGEEATALLDNQLQPCGLVTDGRLGPKPAVDGWDVARHARQLNSRVAVVFVSGDSGVDWMSHGVPKSIMIIKPFAITQVSTAMATC